jgi:hypothetical protein
MCVCFFLKKAIINIVELMVPGKFETGTVEMINNSKSHITVIQYKY